MSRQAPRARTGRRTPARRPARRLGVMLRQAGVSRSPVGVRCDGLYVAITGRERPLPEVLRETKRLSDSVLGPGWRVSPVSATVREVVLVPSGARPPLTVPEGWELARALALDGRVAWAEPALSGPGLQPERIEQALSPVELRTRRATGAVRGRSFVSDKPLPCSKNPMWSLERANVVTAWGQWPRVRGGEIVVGHPDTGYTPHPEIWGADAEGRLLWEHGYDFVAADADPLDDLEGGCSKIPVMERRRRV